jgi:glycosyltransferase involved in cell wall biosynthesis
MPQSGERRHGVPGRPRSNQRKRVALFSIGGIGMGMFSQGQPTMVKVVERLAERFDVTFYSLLPIDPCFEPRGYRLRSPSHRSDRFRIKGHLWWALLKRFLADHRQSPYDVLTSFWGYPMGAFVASLARVARRPSAAVFLGAELASVPEIGYGELRTFGGQRRIALLCAALSSVIVVSTSQIDALRRLGVTRHDLHLIPWGADQDVFGFEPKTLVPPLKIVHVANCMPVKDQATLIEAFALLRETTPAKLRIVGGNFSSGSVRDLVARRGLSADVEFTGPVPYEAVHSQYRWADMFVLTSLSEGQPCALTEAVSCGVLGVSTPVGIASDLGDGAAVIVDKRDPHGIASKIRAIAADPEAWRAKVDKARQWSIAHDFDWTIDQMTGVLSNLCRS